MAKNVKLIGFMLLMVLGFSLAPFPALASTSGSSRVLLPESTDSKLPAGNQLIQRTKRIYQSQELEISAPIKRLMQRIFKFLGDIFKKLLHFLIKRPTKQAAKIDWIKLLKAISLPVIILTIAYVLFHFGSRFKRDIHESQSTARTMNASWQGLIQSALHKKENTPLDALHDLVQAIIRRYVNLGQLPDDPTLTVREIENYLRKRSLTSDQLASFDTLRLIYETVYYGGRPISSNDWDHIFIAVNVIVGEAII